MSLFAPAAPRLMLTQGHLLPIACEKAQGIKFTFGNGDHFATVPPQALPVQASLLAVSKE